MKKFIPLLFGLTLAPFAQASAQQDLLDITPRCRVIIDNDFSGDPDGLFQLVHQVQSQSCEIKAVIGSHLRPNDPFDSSAHTADNAKKEAEKILELMGKKAIPVYAGSNVALTDTQKPVASEATKVILAEMQREDSRPLYYLAGASLTEIANAHLTDPTIDNKFTLIWIGGQEYAGVALPPPNFSLPEYNLNIDISAAQVVFNQSQIPLWQVPRNAYRQTLMSNTELVERVAKQGKVGEYLAEKIANVKKLGEQFNVFIGETYIMGDSPLVLLSALQSSFETDPASSQYDELAAPNISEQGFYEANPNGRKIRVYRTRDTRLMFEDFYAKLKITNKN